MNFGIIGAGRIARTFCEAIKKTDGHLYGIASRDLSKAKSYQEMYHIDKAYGSYEALVSDPNIDCIYVATPHGLHKEHMLLAIEHHKHVISEKSFTLNYHEAETVFEHAKAKGVFVMEAMWTRFLPITKAVKQIIDSGKIGTITHFEASLGFNAQKIRKDRIFDPLMGGGSLLDLGVYPISYAHLFLGVPDHIESSMVLHDEGYDQSCHMTFSYGDVTATLSSSLVEELPNTCIIKGTKGSIVVDQFWMSQHARVYAPDGTILETLDVPHQVNGFEYEIQGAIDAISKGLKETKEITWNDTLSIMKSMDQIRKHAGLVYPSELE